MRAWKPRKKQNRPAIQANSIIETDPAIQNYFGDLMNRRRNNLRKLFTATAKHTPTAVADIDYLCGDRDKSTHNGDTYNLDDLEPLINGYDRFLVDALTLDRDPTNETPSCNATNTTSSEIEPESISL